MPKKKTDTPHCGTIAIIGNPNVGKSTLLNRLIGQKLSITSRKPQTTRQQILGVLTQDDTQMIFVDTPGVTNWESPSAMHRHMSKTAASAVQEVNLILFVVDKKRWDVADQRRLEQVKDVAPVILCLNKVDKMYDKSVLLEHMHKLSQLHEFEDIVPISAKAGDNVDELLQLIKQHCPEGPFLYEEDDLTDRSMKFLAAEFIREKIVRILGQELPYTTAVDIQVFEEDEQCHKIAAVIYVEREGQKPIVIGKQGSRLKKIGQQAREDLEKLFQHKVFLQLWVKVKKDWTTDEAMLKNLGLTQEAMKIDDDDSGMKF